MNPQNRQVIGSPTEVLSIPTQPWFVANAVDTNNRVSLIRFWLAAPEDLLPSLWNSPVGESTTTLVSQLTPQTTLTQDELNLREALNQRLQAGLDEPGTTQLLIAIFLLSPVSQFRIETPERWLPSWLLNGYRSLYEAENTESPDSLETSPAYTTTVPTPNFGDFPGTLRELTGNRLQLNRMLGLANLYYIDPEDQEILEELQTLRLQLVRSINRCPDTELEEIWSTDFGDRYWAVVRSGIQKEPRSQDDENYKQKATETLTVSLGGGFHVSGANKAFLISMLYFIPGEMKVEAAEQKLPAWILPGYQEVFAKPLIQSS